MANRASPITKPSRASRQDARCLGIGILGEGLGATEARDSGGDPSLGTTGDDGVRVYADGTECS